MTVFFFHVRKIHIILISFFIISLLFSFTYQDGWPQAIEGGVDFSSSVLIDVDGDDTLEILIAGNTKWVYLFNHRGELLSGWPQQTTTGSAQETSSPSVGDIDNDGAMEIVYGSDAGKLFAWELDGNDVTGFPVNLGDNVIRACATLEDLDGDDTLEICIGTGVNLYRFFVYRHNGALFFFKNVEGRVHSTAAVADIDKDTSMEIIHGVDRNVQYGVYAWEANGDTCFGWPQETGHHVDGSPALADIDGDSTYEIFVGSIDNNVYAWDYLGNDLASWPNGVGTGIYQGVVSSPAVGDINNDHVLDIVIGRGIIQSSNGAVFAFSANGDTLPNFPIIIATGSVTSSPILADIDGDPDIEIIVGCQDGKLYAFNPDASDVDSFPINVCSSITSSPAVADIDLDGDLEIAVGGNDSLYIWDLAIAYDPDRMPWPMFHHDPQHTGRLPLGTGISVHETGTHRPEPLELFPFIFTGPLCLPQGKNCRIFDITGRTVDANHLAPGIYFIEIQGQITNKVIKVH
jgi:hypothetical protein